MISRSKNAESASMAMRLVDLLDGRAVIATCAWCTACTWHAATWHATAGHTTWHATLATLTVELHPKKQSAHVASIRECQVLELT